VSGLDVLVAEEASAELAPSIAAVAEAARARFGRSALAVLFYGSCLREADDAGKIADLYVLVDDYRTAWPLRLAAAANRLLPPNVLYLEAPFAGRMVRAKVAVISLDDFEAGTRRWFQSYIWARFAQPSRLGYARDAAVRARVLAALADAVRRMAGEAAALLAPPFDARGLWAGALRATYRAELRAERLERADQLVATYAERYDRVTAALAEDGLLAVDAGGYRVADAARRRGATFRWARRRWLGKLLSVLRLLKAAFTFEDGAGYLAWKIQRHSGLEVSLTPWQRRHPILASPALFWRLYRRGAVQ
jgi:hypothetical protein